MISLRLAKKTMMERKKREKENKHKSVPQHDAFRAGRLTLSHSDYMVSAIFNGSTWRGR